MFCPSDRNKQLSSPKHYLYHVNYCVNPKRPGINQSHSARLTIPVSVVITASKAVDHLVFAEKAMMS